ncbi:MAG: hypothetical protein WC674_01170 [Candidatus Krumholzibacteriia bacterium]
MKAAMKKTGLLLFLVGLIQVAGGCIMEERVIELVVNETTCVDFQENHATVSFVNPVTINYANEIQKILDDNGVAREDILSARLVSASYGVTHFPEHVDWNITGSITVERVGSGDGPKTLWDYNDVSVSAALGKKKSMVLIPDGVGVLNKALADFIAGEIPELTFTVDNTGVTPSPSVGDPIVFEWKACIVVDIVAKTDIEVPDPF